jgi:hypothetical protein
MANDNTSDQVQEHELSEKESEELENDLFEMEMLYRTRCVTVPDHSNVVVQEIEDKKTEG